MTDIPDIVKWAENDAGFYLKETGQPITLAPHQAQILRHCFTPDDDGRLPYQTIVLSAPKKSGKTTMAALVALYFALFFEPPNEIYVCANSLEQSQGRSYNDLSASVRKNPHTRKRTTVRNKSISFDNGTEVTALSSDYAGAAGSRHGLTVWDELWAYTTEASYRLWDELTPVPTRRNSVRLVVTYAGFEGESELLENLYDVGQAGEPVAELAHIENGDGEPACRANGRTFVYWDHELKEHAGLTVSPEEYHEQQRKDLRPATYARLHENRWASSIEAFVTAEQWAACYSPELVGWGQGDKRRMVLGADASTARDLTALVGVRREPGGPAEAIYCRVWKPTAGQLYGGKATIDLSATIGRAILRFHELGIVAGVVYDPYQLHSIALDLEKAGVKMIELPQTAQRVEADQALYDAIVGQGLRHTGHPVLTEHVQNAIAKETARGWRLTKEKTRQKIDACVALSMAHHGLGRVYTGPASHLVHYRELQQPSKWRTMDNDPRARIRRNGGRWRRF